MKKSGQFFSAQIDDDGKTIYRTYFPQNWTYDDITEACEVAWENKEILAAWGNYVILQGTIQGNINIRFISTRHDTEIIYHYPMFDAAINNQKITLELPNDSYFNKLKQKVTNLFNQPKEESKMSDAMRNHLKEQFMNNFRKVVLINKMDQAIELKFILSHQGETTEVDHFIGPNDSGQVPYFTPGILTVIHDNKSASVDISDIGTEYIFTVQNNGSVTQISKRESN